MKLSAHPLYSTWAGMKNRCQNSRSRPYADYGGRGIKVCKDWNEDFTKFINDMGEKPHGFTLERIDNNRGYCKENCKWASRKEQMNNRRCNVIIEYNGEKKTMKQWSEFLKIPNQTISARVMKGHSSSRILSPEKFHDFSGLALGGMANGLRNKSKTHCKFGHPFDENNTYYHPKGRTCRKCHANRESQRRKRQ